MSDAYQLLNRLLEHVRNLRCRPQLDAYDDLAEDVLADIEH